MEHRYNRCIDVHVMLRRTDGLIVQHSLGKMIDLKAVQHCEGF